MTTDEDRIRFLMGEVSAVDFSAADAADLRDLEGLADLLADPMLWEEPAGDVGDNVVAAIGGVAGSAAPQFASADESAGSYIAYKRRWRAWVGPAVLGAAAAAIIAVGLVSITSDSDPDVPQADASIVILGTALAPDADGTASFTSTDSGVRIELDVVGLPRRDGDDFYEAWLKSADGERLVPVGTFHDGKYVVLWAGVSFRDYPILTITRETVASPKSADQGSSGEVVAAGAIVP